MAPDLKAQYAAYLQRSVAQMGDRVAVGQYAKIKGRLVKKLDFDEFVERWEHYQAIHTAFEENMARGDTVNDAVMQLLDETATELLLGD